MGPSPPGLQASEADPWTEMKLVVAAIYTNFTTHIVDDVGMEQTDG